MMDFQLGQCRKTGSPAVTNFYSSGFPFSPEMNFFFQISAILASDSTPINALDVISDLIITAKIFMAVLSLTSKK